MTAAEQLAELESAATLERVLTESLWDTPQFKMRAAVT